LRTTVINLSRSALRHRRVAARHVAQEARPVEAVELEAVRAFERSVIVTALRRLPRRQREVLALRYYADLSLGEIAELMGITVGTVKSTLSKGTAACRELIEQP
jgi:RNA polymerase sigma factor (sigma-70 family)